MTNNTAPLNVLQLLHNAGADKDAAPGSQPHALAQAASTVTYLSNGLTALAAELATIARLQDADEVRRRAGWAAADAETLLQRSGLAEACR